MALQGGTKSFWETVAASFAEHDGNASRITFTDFIAGLSAITQGSKEEKLDCEKRLVFRPFASDTDGFYGRDVSAVRCGQQWHAGSRRDLVAHEGRAALAE